MSDTPLSASTPESVTTADADTSVPNRGSRFGSRKFLLAAFGLLVGAYGFLIHLMDAHVYVMLVTLVLSAHGASNITDKKLNPDQQP